MTAKKTKNRKKFSNKYKQKIVEQFTNEDMKIKEFCLKEKITIPNLNRWRKKFQIETSEVKKVSKKKINVSSDTSLEIEIMELKKIIGDLYIENMKLKNINYIYKS